MSKLKKTKGNIKVVKLQIPAGKATPAPPVGTALGPFGLNLPGFCKQFNDETLAIKGVSAGDLIPVVITISGKKFTLEYKKPPTAFMIKKVLGIDKGSTEPGRSSTASISNDEVLAIAENKIVDMNTIDLDMAVNMVAGTARSMGIVVE